MRHGIPWAPNVATQPAAPKSVVATVARVRRKSVCARVDCFAFKVPLYELPKIVVLRMADEATLFAVRPVRIRMVGLSAAGVWNVPAIRKNEKPSRERMKDGRRRRPCAAG